MVRDNTYYEPRIGSDSTPGTKILQRPTQVFIYVFLRSWIIYRHSRHPHCLPDPRRKQPHPLPQSLQGRNFHWHFDFGLTSLTWSVPLRILHLRAVCDGKWSTPEPFTDLDRSWVTRVDNSPLLLSGHDPNLQYQVSFGVVWPDPTSYSLTTMLKTACFTGTIHQVDVETN